MTTGTPVANIATKRFPLTLSQQPTGIPIAKIALMSYSQRVNIAGK